MSLLNIPIPNLLNGVSQQPPNLRFPTQCEIQENAYSSIVEGLGKRPPSEHLSLISSNSAYAPQKIHGIDRGDSTERYLAVFSGANGGLSVYNLNGQQQTLYWDGDSTRRAAAEAYLNCSGADPNITLKCVSIGDYTFIVNTSKVVGLSNTLSAAQDEEAIVWVKQGAYSTKYSVTGNFSAPFTTATTGTAIVSTTLDGELFTTISHVDTAYIAANLSTVMTNISQFSTYYTKTRKGYVIHLKKLTQFPFDIDVSDGLSGNGLGLVHRTVASFDDLPSVAMHGMLIGVKGVPGTTADDYWVRFVATGGSGIGEGVWEEAAGPSLKNDFNYSTMPIVLIRQANGTFLVKMADGITPSSAYPAGGPGISGNYGDAKWSSRGVGDEATNPAPSFVGSTISDAFLFRGRLGFLSGESVVLSEAGGFFNFWRTTVTQVLDSDSIDISSSYPSVTPLRHAVPFSDRLVLFSDKVQFVLGTRQSILSGSTATLTPVSNYDVLKNCRPVPVNDGIFFAFDRGGYSGFRQMIVNTSDSEQLTAPDISAHVPKYIAGNVYNISCSSHDNVMATVTASEPDSIYIYKWYDADAERVQSSWSKWVFHNAKILGITWMQTSLYAVVWRNFGASSNGNIYLEKVTIEPNRKDTYSKFIITLDRRVTPTSSSYNSTTNQTTLTIPYAFGSLGVAYAPVVTKKATVSSEAGYLINTVSYQDTGGAPQTQAQVVVSGNVSHNDVWVGIPYKMKYQFSQPYLKQSDGNRPVAISSGRFQVRNMNLVYDNSSNFTVYVSYKFGGNQYSYPWSGNILGTGQAVIGNVLVEAGSFKIPVYGRNSEIYISIENFSHLPSNFLSAEIEASYDSRSKRV